MPRWRRSTPPAGPAAPDPQEEAIVTALAGLRTTTAREVMTPRVDVVALEMPVTAEAVAQAVRESGHSRFPVFEETLDSLAGVLFVKDLFRMAGPAPAPELIARRLRKPYLVPESRRVLDVLTEMRTRRLAFAVVVDEYGGVAGVLTVKDLVSELVGEMPDEFDPVEEDDITRIDASRWLLDGGTPVDRVVSELGAPVPLDGDYVTVGGFLFDRFGRIPEEGDEIVCESWLWRVAEMDRRRVAKVVVKAPAVIEEPSGNVDATGK